MIRRFFYRKCNNDADVAAKHAISLHPSDGKEMEAVERTITIAKTVCKLAAKVLLLWPRIDLTNAPRMPDAPPRMSHDKPAHDWVEWSGLWRCRVCLLGSRCADFPAPGVCPGCSKLDEGVLLGLGHKVLAFPCSDGSHLFVCMRCRFHSTGARIDGLGKLCNGSPSRHAEYAWRDLYNKGEHPNPRRKSVVVDVSAVTGLFGSAARSQAARPLAAEEEEEVPAPSVEPSPPLGAVEEDARDRRRAASAQRLLAAARSNAQSSEPADLRRRDSAAASRMDFSFSPY